MKAFSSILISLAMFVVFALPASADTVMESEARTVANNWIKVIIAKKGSWGDSNEARVASISEFKRKARTIGYFCKVEPMGYIIVSLRKELAPVKVYSDTSNLDPDCEKGLADLIKGKMEWTILEIEKKAGHIQTAKTQDITSILEIDYSSSWDELLSGMVGVNTKESKAQGQLETMNYQASQILLKSSWDQGDPYNTYCPSASGGCTSARCLVGCVATAGAQILRYWAWPPNESSGFDWVNMPDRVFAGPTPPRSPQAQIDAVALLCSHVGVQVGMSYCSDDCESSSYTRDMQGVYVNNYRYSSSCNKKDRSDYTAVEWFELMKAQLNQNRPIHYRISGHSIVADGWQEIGTGPTRQYHMNYGWDNSYTTWYTLDALYYPAGGGLNDEYIIKDIYPGCAVYDTISGDYMKTSLGYRYFDQDATGDSGTFWAGQKLQFLPRVKVTCTGGSIRFEGTPSANTRLFSIKGAADGGHVAGIRIYNGGLRLYNNGSLRFH